MPTKLTDLPDCLIELLWPPERFCDGLLVGGKIAAALLTATSAAIPMPPSTGSARRWMAGKLRSMPNLIKLDFTGNGRFPLLADRTASSYLSGREG
jgi:hypothetical protein